MMSEPRSAGRRRAEVPHQRIAAKTAPPARVALMWSTISSTHEVLDRRRRYFETTESDLRLGEQLTLLPDLQDWIPVTIGESAEIVELLDIYLVTEDEEIREHAALAVSRFIRAMAEHRAAGLQTRPGG